MIIRRAAESFETADIFYRFIIDLRGFVLQNLRIVRETVGVSGLGRLERPCTSYVGGVDSQAVHPMSVAFERPAVGPVWPPNGNYTVMAACVDKTLGKSDYTFRKFIRRTTIRPNNISSMLRR